MIRSTWPFEPRPWTFRTKSSKVPLAYLIYIHKHLYTSFMTATETITDWKHFVFRLSIAHAAWPINSVFKPRDAKKERLISDAIQPRLTFPAVSAASWSLGGLEGKEMHSFCPPNVSDLNCDSMSQALFTCWFKTWVTCDYRDLPGVQ